MNADWITAWGTAGLAVGTVGTLLISLRVLRVEQIERLRSEVQGLRCWLSPAEDEEQKKTADALRAARRNPEVRANLESRLGKDWVKDVLDDDKMFMIMTREEFDPILVIENKTNTVVYDVRAQIIAPEILDKGVFLVSRPGMLVPDQKEEYRFNQSIEKGLWQDRSLGSAGAEVLFFDSRGNRWHRDDRGLLRRKKPNRLWAPWRYPHRLDMPWGWPTELPRHLIHGAFIATGDQRLRWWMLAGWWHYRYLIGRNRGKPLWFDVTWHWSRLRPRVVNAFAKVADIYGSPGAADLYYGEMEMRRLDRSTSWSERSIIWLYWITSGYGLHATRSIISLFIALLVGSVLMVAWGLDTENPSIRDALVAAGQSFVPGLRVTGRLTNWGQALHIVLTVVGLIFMGLTALALGNRVKR